jgi:hypothetical protein
MDFPLRPKDIFDELHKSVVGQDEAIRELSVALVKHLRRELDKRGLQSVQIIAPEHASADGVLNEQVDALKNDAAAWSALDGIASHSYNMAASGEIARRITGPDDRNLKEYWMTEASDNGPEAPETIARGRFGFPFSTRRITASRTGFITFRGMTRKTTQPALSPQPQPAEPVMYTHAKYISQLDNLRVGAMFCASRVRWKAT